MLDAEVTFTGTGWHHALHAAMVIVVDALGR
jgi:hypothetical protein